MYKEYKYIYNNIMNYKTIFIRQPLTQTSNNDIDCVKMVFDQLRIIENYRFVPTLEAQNKNTFKIHFTDTTGMEFTPTNFRNYRLFLIDNADAIVYIRTGLSESGHFELGYNFAKENPIPVLFLYHSNCPITTTLSRELPNVSYVEFNENMLDHIPDELRKLVN